MMADTIKSKQPKTNFTSYLNEEVIGLRVRVLYMLCRFCLNMLVIVCLHMWCQS